MPRLCTEHTFPHSSSTVPHTQLQLRDNNLSYHNTHESMWYKFKIQKMAAVFFLTIENRLYTYMYIYVHASVIQLQYDHENESFCYCVGYTRTCICVSVCCNLCP